MFNTSWTTEQQLEGSASIAYDFATATYDDSRYNYNGQFLTDWVNEPVSS